MNSSKKARVVICTCRGSRHHAVVNAVAASHDVRGIVLEDQSRLFARLLLRRMRKLGLWTVLNQLAYKVLDTLMFRRQAESRSEHVFGPDGVFDETRFAGIPVIDTRSVNSREVVDLMRQIRPDVVVVSGTSLLRKPLLEVLTDIPVINIHCGITPRYRGTHGAFWAIVNEDWDNVGTTVHFIDEGLDTGGIIDQRPIEVAPDDSPRMLALRQYQVAIPMISDAVSRAATGTITELERNDLDSRVYSSPTFTAYLLYRKRMRERVHRTRTSSKSASTTE